MVAGARVLWEDPWMLKIDRHGFLALALGMNLGACYTSAGMQSSSMGQQRSMPGPTGEEAYAPAQECVGWTPTGECNQWQPVQEAAYAPAQECVGWTPTGECSRWEPRQEAFAPTQECVGWSPTGECSRWEPRRE